MPAADLQLDWLAPLAPTTVAAPAPAPAAKPRWRKPRVSREEVAKLESRLRGHGWQTRSELGVDERQLRLWAEASDGAVLSYPGSPGSRLFDEASKREWDQCDAAFTRQIDAMKRRRKRVEEARRL